MANPVAPYYIRAVIEAYTMGKPDITANVAEQLKADGLIELTPMGQWNTTPKGAAYVRLLQEVPLPEQRWVDPRTEKRNG